MSTARASVRLPAADRTARLAERVLRVLGDARTGVALIAGTGIANLAAALLPSVRPLLDGPGYAALLGTLALSGVAAVAVRAPVAWREWRRPGPVTPGAGALSATVVPLGADEAAARLEDGGYRVRIERGRGRWSVHGVRRGWSRFAGIGSHLALVVLVAGAAVGAAFGSETVFSLLPGDQALLAAPRPGFSSAVRLDSLDAEFGPGGRPTRLDTHVTFLRDGEPIRAAVLRVNEPGAFDGFLVHPWTYGPAARLRVTTLDGSALLDAAVPLDDERDGRPVGATQLPSLGLTLGLVIADAGANLLGVSAVGPGGLLDAAQLRPGETARLGDVEVKFNGFDAWVTLMARRDPGQALVLAGGIGLCLALAVAFWLPRRRVTLRPRGDALFITLRGERFDRPSAELERLRRVLGLTP